MFSDDEDAPPAKRALIETKSIKPLKMPQHYSSANVNTRVTTLYHQWIIENFSYHCLESQNGSECPCIYSPVFNSPTNEKIQFQLYMRTRGDGQKTNANLISLYLKMCECDRKEVTVNFDMWVLDSNGDHQIYTENKKKFTKNQTWGYKDYCSREEILNVGKLLIPGDVLTIYCKIWYEEMTIEQLKFDQEQIDKSIQFQLHKDCSRLWNDTKLADVVLVFGSEEGVQQKIEFPAHKAILAARSTVFAAMFQHNMQEKANNRVEMTDVAVEVGKQLLKYIYTDEVSNHGVFAAKLLPVADKYELDTLKTICEGFLCFRLNPESVGDLLLLSDMHNAVILKLKAIEYIHCHATFIVEKENFKNLISTRPELYYELFKFNSPQEPSCTWAPPVLSTDPFLERWSYTGSKVIDCSQRWCIEQFGTNHLSAESKVKHEFVESMLFSSQPNNNSVQFSVKLFPRGENEQTKDHLSLYLQLKCASSNKIAVKCRVSIVVNANSAKCHTMEINKKLSNGESIGWPKFIDREQLKQNSTLLLDDTNDRLVLLCEVFYIENIDCLVTKAGANTFHQQHRHRMARDFAQLYPTDKFTDVVFVLGDKQFPVHKAILCARSKVFARMFEFTHRVQIDDEDPEAFEQMLRLVYGQTDSLQLYADKLLPLMDKYRLSLLKQICETVLCGKLSPESVANYLILSDKHNAPGLKARAFEYVHIHHAILTEKDTLKVVQQENPKLFYELLCFKLKNWSDTRKAVPKSVVLPVKLKQT